MRWFVREMIIRLFTGLFSFMLFVKTKVLVFYIESDSLSIVPSVGIELL